MGKVVFEVVSVISAFSANSAVKRWVYRIVDEL